VMEARRIRLQGERGISRQTIAQGMPECSGCTCMLVCAFFYTLHTRPRVQQAPGIPCTLRFRGGDKFMQTSGALCRENAKLYSPSLRAKRSNPKRGARRRGLLRFARNDADKPRRTGYPPHLWRMTRPWSRAKSSSQQRERGFGHAHVKGRFRGEIDND